jgi:hypothetical protein
VGGSERRIGPPIGFRETHGPGQCGGGGLGLGFRFHAKAGARLIGDLGAKRTNIRDLPRLNHLPGPFVGPDAIVSQFERLRADWAEQRFDDVRVVATDGDWVVIEYRWHVRAESAQADFDRALASKLNEGRIVELQYRWKREEALEAAGLSE